MPDKIAICFLTTKDIENLEIWENWWKGNEDKISVYAHFSRKTGITQKILLDNRVPPVPTRWGDISLVHAERQLYREALKNKSNKFFLLASNTCVPVRSFSYTYNRLMKNKKKGMVAWRDFGKIEYGDPLPFITEGNCDKYMKQYGFYKDPLYTCDQWKILSRPNAKDFLEMYKEKNYVKLFERCIKVVPESLAPDELMFINFMNHKYRGDLKSQMRNKLVTFVDFKGKAIHPITYKQITPSVREAICETNAMFVRKIVNPQITKIIQQTPVTCPRRN